MEKRADPTRVIAHQLHRSTQGLPQKDIAQGTDDCACTALLVFHSQVVPIMNSQFQEQLEQYIPFQHG
ncbi:hypothetical protein EGX94_11355 [Propionibacterium acidifaciens]|nr:hypothetical protein EGX94_11355 [Propionibacterium acidifaciens]